MSLLFRSMGILGMGNGAVCQLVPQRFSKYVGVSTGVVGAAGGRGGFLLPSVLGAIKDRTSAYGIGFLVFASAFVVVSAVLLQLGRTWSLSGDEGLASRAGVFSYRHLVRSLVPADEA
jgi:NNP family nitrate/nitrite transporter-like MFS transporter